MLGADTANLTEETSRFYAEMREIMLPIKQVILGELTTFMRGLRVVIEAVGPEISAGWAWIQQWMKIVEALLNWQWDEAVKLRKDMDEAIEEARKRGKKPGDLMDEFFRLMRVGGDFGQGPRAVEILRQQLNAPALAGM